MQRKINIPGLTEEDMAKLDSIFLSEKRVSSLILYGSRATGTFRAGSDIDLALKSDELSVRQLARMEMEIDDLLLPYNLDISIYGQIENLDLLEHIRRVGIVIYE